MLKEAVLYEKLPDNKVKCKLCARRCTILDGRRGACGVRENRGGTLYTRVYGVLSAFAVDPVEKKPLYHFNPGSSVASISTFGCNLFCRYCLDGNEIVPVIVKGHLKFMHARDFDKFFGDSSAEGVVDTSREPLFAITTLGPRRIVSVSRRRASGPMYEVVTKRGRKVKLTGDHVVPVWNGENEPEEKKASELKPGDRVKVFSGSLALEKKVMRLNLLKDLVEKVPLKLLERIYVRNAEGLLEKLRRRGVKLTEVARALGLKPSTLYRGSIPILSFSRLAELYQLTEEDLEGVTLGVKGSSHELPALLEVSRPFMRLLGYFVAEGNYAEGTLALTSGNEGKLRDMERCVKEVFKTRPTRVKVRGKAPQLFFGWKLGYLLFRFVLGIPEGSKSKRIPDLVFNVDKHLLKEFLSAYLTGDGTLCRKKDKIWVRFVTTSKDVRTQLCYLLALHGINFTVQSPKYVRTLPDGRKGPVQDFRIDVYDRDSLVKLREIAVFLDERQEVVEKYVSATRRSMKRSEPQFDEVDEVRLVEQSHRYVYDIALEGEGCWREHTFFAGDGILIHNCCNWLLSQTRDGFSAEAIKMGPEDVVERAKREGAGGISYTYNEPTIFMEFAYDTAKLARREGLFNTFVTNGFMTPEAVEYIAPYLDAATVDFKGAGNPEFYRKFALAPSAEPIYEALLELKRRGIHIEITNLVVPDVGVGDKEEDVRKLAKWIVENLGPETPLHLIRFFPNYLMLSTPPTPVGTLVKLHSVAKAEGLHYVYVGNVPGHELDNTYCPGCGATLIERYGFWIRRVRLEEGDRCPRCGFKVAIKWFERKGG